MKLIFTFTFVACFTACTSTKHSSQALCEKFYSYKTNKIDVQGINLKLKSQGVDVADFGVGNVTVDPKVITPSDKLQLLDMQQYELCKLLNSFPENDTAQIRLRKQYAELLLELKSYSTKKE